MRADELIIAGHAISSVEGKVIERAVAEEMVVESVIGAVTLVERCADEKTLV